MELSSSAVGRPFERRASATKAAASISILLFSRGVRRTQELLLKNTQIHGAKRAKS